LRIQVTLLGRDMPYQLGLACEQSKHR
jgi:hypothetical protein